MVGPEAKTRKHQPKPETAFQRMIGSIPKFPTPPSCSDATRFQGRPKTLPDRLPVFPWALYGPTARSSDGFLVTAWAGGTVNVFFRRVPNALRIRSHGNWGFYHGFLNTPPTKAMYSFFAKPVPGRPLKVGALEAVQCPRGVSFAMRIHYISFEPAPSG